MNVIVGISYTPPHQAFDHMICISIQYSHMCMHCTSTAAGIRMVIARTSLITSSVKFDCSFKVTKPKKWYLDH